MSPLRSLAALAIVMSLVSSGWVAGRTTSDATAEVLAYTVTATAEPAEPTFAVAGLAPAPLQTGARPAPPPRAPSYVETGGRALQRLDYPWQRELPGWTIEFKPARALLRGRTIAGDRRIEIYVHTTNESELARIIAHEFGHAGDITYNDTATRRAWKSTRGIDASVPWWPAAGYPDFATGSGDFAECFATWQSGSASRSSAGACSNADLGLVAELLGG